MRKLFSKLLAGLFPLVAFPTILLAQNLVPNPGFELTDGCTTAGIPGTLVQANPWTGPTCSPDLFQYCTDRDNFSLPMTVFGDVDAFSGNAIAGMHLARKEGVNSTGPVTAYEKLQVELSDTLKRDSFYEVILHIAAEMSNPYDAMFIDRIGIHLSSQSFVFYNEFCQTDSSVDTLFTIGNTLSTPAGEIIDDVGVWRKYCWIYKAKGTESNIMIGYFNPPETINFISLMPVATKPLSAIWFNPPNPFYPRPIQFRAKPLRTTYGEAVTSDPRPSIRVTGRSLADIRIEYSLHPAH